MFCSISHVFGGHTQFCYTISSVSLEKKLFFIVDREQYCICISLRAYQREIGFEIEMYCWRKIIVIFSNKSDFYARFIDVSIEISNQSRQNLFLLRKWPPLERLLLQTAANNHSGHSAVKFPLKMELDAL